MTVTPDDVIAIASEFATTDPDTIQAAIDRAERRTSADAWGNKYSDGVCYLTAHLLTLDARSASAGAGTVPVAGAVTAEQVGPLRREFGSTATTTAGIPWSNPWLESTLWGQAYAELRSLVFPSRMLPSC